MRSSAARRFLQTAIGTAFLALISACAGTDSVGVSPSPDPVSLTVTSLAASLHGSRDSSSQSFSITSAQPGVAWSAESNAEWVRLSTTSGVTPSTVVATIAGGALAVGSHSARITISTVARDGAHKQTIVVALEVLPQPIVQADPASIAITGSPGQTTFGQRTIAITNAGTGALTWAATSSDPWIVVTPTSGSGAGAVTLDINATGLTPGAHAGAVTIVATGATGSPVVVPVTVTVTPLSFNVSTASNPTGGGTATGSGLYAAGTVATVVAAPAPDYEFVNWADAGKIVSTGATYAFLVASDRVLTANFRAHTVTIAATADPPAGGTISGGGNAAVGSTVTVVATPAQSYSFSAWTEGQEVVSRSASYTFTASVDRALVATFVPAPSGQAAIAASASPTGGGTIDGLGTYVVGGTAQLTAIPNPGFTFVDWRESGAVVATTPTYSFPVTTPRTLVANFAGAPPTATYQVTAIPTPVEGGVTFGGGRYAAGATVTVRAQARDGYVLSRWTESGTAVSTSAEYTFVVAGDRVLNANFTNLNTSVTINANANPATLGSVSGGGIVLPGATVTVTATPVAGATFVSWTENGTVVSTSARYTFTAAGNRTLVANFTSPISIQLTAPALNSTASFGDTLAVSATISSASQLTAVRAAIGVRQIALTQTSPGVWTGKLPLVGLARGNLDVAVSATDVTGATVSVSRTFFHDTAPVLTIASPRDFDVARPTIALSVSCADDDPNGCVSVELRFGNRGGSILQSGTTSLSGTLSLAAYDGSAVTLVFVATDSRGNLTQINRTVYVESSTQLSEIGAADGKLLDERGGRGLYLTGAESGAHLAVRTFGSGADDRIITPSPLQVNAGFVSPTGAIFAGATLSGNVASMYDWRNGALTTTPIFNSNGIDVSDRYAAIIPSSSLLRRDLTTGADVTVSGIAANTGFSVGPDGSVAYWTNGTYAIDWYRNGTTTQLTHDDPNVMWDILPVTDGINVVYQKRTPCCANQQYAIAMSNGTSETLLTPQTGTAPSQYADYTANGGWIAYTQSDANGVRQLWLRDPSGTVRQVSSLGASVRIDALATDGTTVFHVSQGRRYIASAASTPRDIGSSVGTVLWRDGDFVLLLGRKAFHIAR